MPTNSTRWQKASDLRHPSCRDSLGQVISRLHVQPKLRRGPQGFGKIECRLCGDASFASYQLIQARSAPADLLCESRLAHSHGLKKFLKQYFARMKRIFRLFIHGFLHPLVKVPSTFLLFTDFSRFRQGHHEGLATEFSMVGNGKAMGFVPDALDQAGDV